ncbi:MAG: cation transporter [Thermoproteota archaeon]|nr:cation transporter [Thermoproteota archaeon]
MLLTRMNYHTYFYEGNMTTERALFKVVGMYCTSCKSIVENQLKDEKGVIKVDINYMTDSITVDFNSSLITNEQIKNRLEKSGYKFVRVAQ